MMPKVVVVFCILLSGTSCASYVTSKATEVCDRPNVYCGEDEQAEREFKRESLDAALLKDIATTAKVVGKTVEAVSSDRPQPIPDSQPEPCEQGTRMICSTVKGCFCE